METTFDKLKPGDTFKLDAKHNTSFKKMRGFTIGVNKYNCVRDDGHNCKFDSRDTVIKEMSIEDKLGAALTLLADWAIAVDTKGTMWDDWDNHYKAVMYGRNPIADLVDAKIKERRKSDFWK